MCCTAWVWICFDINLFTDEFLSDYARLVTIFIIRLEISWHSTTYIFFSRVEDNTSLSSVIINHFEPGPFIHRLKRFCKETLQSLKFFVRKFPKVFNLAYFYSGFCFILIFHSWKLIRTETALTRIKFVISIYKFSMIGIIRCFHLFSSGIHPLKRFLWTI